MPRLRQHRAGLLGHLFQQVTLKSNVNVVSVEGPDLTAIRSPASPAITATGVTSATLVGFTVSSATSPTSATVGIDLLDSDIVISLYRQRHRGG